MAKVYHICPTWRADGDEKPASWFISGSAAEIVKNLI